MLVKSGANLFLYDYENQAPLHVAKRRKRKNLFKYFKQKMKDEEPAWICDVSNTGWDSPTEPTSSASSGIESDAAHIIIKPIYDGKNDDNKDKEEVKEKEKDVDVLSDDDNDEISQTLKLDSRPSSKQHSLTPPTSTTQPSHLTTAALGISPFNPPSAVAGNFMSHSDSTLIQLPPAMKRNLHSNESNVSTFSQQSSVSSNDGIKDRETDENDQNHGNGHDLSYQPLKLGRSGSVKQSSNPVISSRRKYQNKRESPQRYAKSPGPQSQHHQYRPSYQPQSVSDSQHSPQTGQSRQRRSQEHHHSKKKVSRPPTIQSQAHLWMAQHQQKLKQVQENKLRMALKIEQSHLNKEVFLFYVFMLYRQI